MSKDELIEKVAEALWRGAYDEPWGNADLPLRGLYIRRATTALDAFEKAQEESFTDGDRDAIACSIFMADLSDKLTVDECGPIADEVVSIFAGLQKRLASKWHVQEEIYGGETVCATCRNVYGAQVAWSLAHPSHALTDDAQAEAARRWPSPNSGLYEGLTRGFVLGAAWSAEKAWMEGMAYGVNYDAGDYEVAPEPIENPYSRASQDAPTEQEKS